MLLAPARVFHADIAVEAFRWVLIVAAVLFLLVFLMSALGGSFSFFGYYWF